jgi:DNA invertase Pin-like site-specific DNA recombinase
MTANPLHAPPSALSPGSTVWAYLRDSGGPNQDRSIEQQRNIVTEYCLAHNLVLSRVFSDVHKSGGTTAGRDQFEQMVATSASEADRPAGLIIWNFARFARDVDDSQIYKGILRKRGIVIHSLTDDIPEGPFSAVIETIIHVADEQKKKEAALGSWRGLRHIVKQGAIPGNPPRGFKREPLKVTSEDGTERTAHRWVPDPDLIPLIKKAFAMKAAGASLIQIHQLGIYGSLNSYHTFFSNKLYIGVLEYGDMTIPNYCEPMIDLKTWDAVQKILDLHADRQHISQSEIHPRRRTQIANYLLSGISYCSRCKAPLSGLTATQRSGTNYTRYACTRAKRRHDCDLKPIPAKQLEQMVIGELSAFFDDPANLQALLDADREQALTISAEIKEQAKAVQKKLTALQRSIANITDAIAERGHSKSILEKLDSLERQETELQTTLHSIKTSAPKSPEPISLEELTAFGKNIAAHLRFQDNLTRRAILHTIVNQVFVDRIQNHVYAIIYIHSPSPREPESPEDCYTVPKSPTTVGAPLYRHSIKLVYEIKHPRR